MNSKSISLAQRGDSYTGTLRIHDTLGVCPYMHFFGFPVYPVCTLPHPFSCNNEYKVNNGNNIGIIVHNVEQSVLLEPLTKKYFIAHLVTLLQHYHTSNNSVIRGALI